MLDTKPKQKPNKILRGHVPLAPGANQVNHALGGSNLRLGRDIITDGRVLPRELLDDGQGKSTTLDMEISDSSDGSNWSRMVNNKNPHPGECNQQRLLLPPIIVATDSLATGATTEVLRKQNKHHRNEALLGQPMGTQWTIHQGRTILPHNHWEKHTKTADDAQMAPQGLALKHEAAGVLAEWE
jgi:hypothetical protein